MKASSFPSEELAERLIARALHQNADRISAWRGSGAKSKLELESTFGQPIGTTVDRWGNVTEAMSVRVVLIPNDKMKDGWQILTAFPV